MSAITSTFWTFLQAGDEVITEFDGIPLPQPPPFLTATLAALIPSYPPLLADLATEILTVDPTAREADIWTSVAGWTRNSDRTDH